MEEIEKSTFEKLFEQIFPWIVWLIIICFITYYSFARIRNNLEWKIDFDYNGKIMVQESVSPFGSWLTPDRIVFEEQFLIIEKRSINNTFVNSQMNIPYKKIKFTAFKNGVFWDEISICSESQNFNMYFFKREKKEGYEFLRTVPQIILTWGNNLE